MEKVSLDLGIEEQCSQWRNRTAVADKAGKLALNRALGSDRSLHELVAADNHRVSPCCSCVFSSSLEGKKSSLCSCI
jgi:hypothetical protein